MKKRFLCLALVLVMLVGIIPLSAITAFAADPTSSQSNDVETVTVTTFDELRSALSAEGDANIVLGNDISVRDYNSNIYTYHTAYADKVAELIPEGATPAPHSEWDDAYINGDFRELLLESVKQNFLIFVNGNKTLDLNGHNIFAYLANIGYYYYYRAYEEFRLNTNNASDLKEYTLITVNADATLNIDDTSNEKAGSIFFDGQMYDVPASFTGFDNWYYKNSPSIRNIIDVYGTLNVFDGVIEAGRSKEQWIVDGTLDPTVFEKDGYQYHIDFVGPIDNDFDGYAYQQIWGSAVTVKNGGTFNSFGGYYYGRGEGYYSDYLFETERANGKLDKTLDNEDQDYRRDEVVYVASAATVNVYGGYFEGKGGANVFGACPSRVKVYDGEFKNHKVDYVRCLDAAATNDDDSNPITFSELFDTARTPIVITGSYGETGLKEDNYYEWSESGLGIKNAFVNGEARADGEIVPVKLKDGTASIKFEWNGLSENLEKAGCKLYPVVQYYLGKTKGLHPYEIVDNSAIITTPLSYEGQKSTFKFDFYLLMPDGKQMNIGSHTVVVSVEKEEIESVSISLDTLVGGATPANYEGKVNTTGVSIVEEAWYEYNGGSLKKMNDSDKFVAGNQYVYGVTFAFGSGYKFNPFTTVNINGIAARKSGDYFHWTSAVMTAKAELVANAVNSTVTVANGDTVTLKVNATGEGLEYVWQVDETVGAPSVDRNFYDNITLECVSAGTYTYKCIVKDANGSRKTVEFTVKVLPKETSGTVPAQPAFKGSGFMDVEDSDNITVEKDGSITLIPNYVFNMNSNDITTTPVVGEVSFTWQIYAYDENDKMVGTPLGNVTTENLVIDADSEYINTKNVAKYGIMLTITNAADGQQNSWFTGATVYVVEPESTGDLGGQIGAEQEESPPYALRRMSARSAENFEGTIVYLVKDEKVVYVTEANADGYYLFTSIPYGSYSVKVEKEGYENYSKDVEVNQANNDCDITIIKHVCFADEGNEMSISAKQPNCEMGELGNIECRVCISCGKYYDVEGNLIADSAADPGSLNENSVPYAALLYPVHDYCGEAQEGGNADQYLRHRAETCLEETTYWHYCINGNCKKSAGDDPSSVDKYYVGSASNQTHSYTVQSTDGDYFKEDTGVDCQDNKWYYYACEYCGMRDSSSIWMSEEKGPHIPHEDDGDCTTPITCTCGEVLTAGAASHTGGTATCTAKAKCDVCGKEYGETLAHTHGTEWKNDATNHWNECACGDKANVAPHADTNNDEKCDACSYAMPKAPSNNETEKPTEKPTDATDKPTDATESEKDDSTETEAPADKGCGGCGSSAALSALAIVAVVGSALVIKKKED